MRISPSSSAVGLSRLAPLAAAIFGLAVLPASLSGGDVEVPDGPDGGTVIFGEGHVWSFFRGTQALPEGWTAPGFDDSTWEEGPAGIGYGDGDDRTVLEDMRCAPPAGGGGGDGENPCTEGGYLAFFARTAFETPEVPAEQGLFVKVSYDDGFVLYMNGVEVGRVNLPEGEISWQTAALKAIGDAPNSPDASIRIPLELLRAEGNVLAASVHNVNVSSSDVSFVPRLIVGAAGDPDPEEPTCKELCGAAASEALKACLAEGLPEKECLARKAAAFEACLAAKCGVEPPDPEEPTCKELCGAAASAALKACLAEGLPEKECLARKAAAFEACLREQCDIQPPEEPTCEARCEQGAAKAYKLCREDGGTEEACLASSGAALKGCKDDCGEKPPEKPCGDECAATGHAVFLACLEAGGGKEECRRQADGIVALCLERCGVGTPCESRCSVAAQVVLTGCGLAGLPDEECRAMANSILERCVGACEPAPSCESRCEDLAERAIEECAGREGPDDECEGVGAAVLAECLAHCEGKPVPDCDRQCEGKAAAMLEECLAGGKGEGECAALRDAFLAKCREELGEVCEGERLALQSAFQLFERGDANRDGGVNISDGISILGHLFFGDGALPCEDAADTTDDGKIDISDPILVLSVLFLGSGSIPEPAGGRKGQDPTADGLLCAF